MNASRLARQLGKDTRYVFLSFPSGLVALVLSMTLFWVGVGLTVIWIGLPLLLSTFLLVRGLAVTERERVEPVLGHGLRPVRYRGAAGPGLKARILAPLSDRQSWLDLVHAMFRFIPDTIAFGVLLTWWAGAVGGVTAVLWDWAIPHSAETQDLAWLLGLGDSRSARLALYLAFGLLFALTLIPVARGMAKMNASFARMLLSPAGEREPASDVPAGPAAHRRLDDHVLSGSRPR